MPGRSPYSVAFGLILQLQTQQYNSVPVSMALRRPSNTATKKRYQGERQRSTLEPWLGLPSPHQMVTQAWAPVSCPQPEALPSTTSAAPCSVARDRATADSAQTTTDGAPSGDHVP